MDWSTLAVGAVMSAIVGMIFSAFLPRGVVLTRTPLGDVRDGTFEALADRWTLRNDSAVPARVRGAEVTNPEGSRKLPPNEEGDDTLLLDDEVDEITRVDRATQWSNVEVRPGDALIAHVPNNTTLFVRYRRAGRSGILERREVRIHGGV